MTHPFSPTLSAPVWLDRAVLGSKVLKQKKNTQSKRGRSHVNINYLNVINDVSSGLFKCTETCSLSHILGALIGPGVIRSHKKKGEETHKSAASWSNTQHPLCV